MNLNKAAQLVTFVCLLALSIQASAEEQDELQLGDLQVAGEGGGIRTVEQQTFSQAGAVSSIGEIKSFQSLDSSVRALPGTYTNINPTQGTISVNIRGESGFGRVNTMVDGVPQTFYGTSSNSASKYHAEDGGYGPSSQYGVMIDPNFLVRTDVIRGFSDGASGVNALTGSANFRTIGVDDVVFHDQKFGVLSKLNYGSNGVGPNAMLAFGAKHKLSNEGSLAAMFAYSGSKTQANYKRGDGSYSADNDYVRRLDQEPRSWLAKLEIKPNSEHNLLFSARDYKNNVGGRKTTNSAYGIEYNYNPSSLLVDVHVLAAYTKNAQLYNEDANIWVLSNGRTDNKSAYLEVDNTAKFTWRDIHFATEIGASLLTNSYSKKATGVDQDNLDYTPFSPTGKQRLASLYLTNIATWHDWELTTGVTYTYGYVGGYKPACDGDDVECFPYGAAQIKIKSQSLLPSVMLAWQKYDWFKPFISYSESSRLPNINEVFFNNQGAGSINPFLRPESAKTYQLGFNTEKENAFVDGDFLGLKLLGFLSYEKDRIYSRSFYLRSNGTRTTNLDEADKAYQAHIYVNALDKIKSKGIELSLNYDMGSFFTELSYTYQKQKLPVDVTATVGTGFGTTSITTLPEHYATLGLGGRFCDKKLIIGSLIKYTGKNRRINPAGLQINQVDDGSQEMPKMPIIVDLYTTYQLSKNVLLKASIQNVMNKNYVDALNSLNSTASQYDVDDQDNDVFSFSNIARGRTFFIGAEIRF
ncbi:TonB-dependent receptor [Gallibacterium salpingitidis]|uniref:TonB-dependent receptor domain-containing protein n=1 Tax=Gallibacterium salpingitidis TaxID=505341 RepID=UPI0026708FA6|nr:TonB-dependent receptor [Gallibacterium salpingitidis]WKS99846.1 TonB-dependent receptor [Gallibacterium salpingitidis]